MLQQEYGGGGGEVVEVIEELITGLGEIKILRKTVKQQAIRFLLARAACSFAGLVQHLDIFQLGDKLFASLPHLTVATPSYYCRVFAMYHMWFGRKTYNASIETNDYHIGQSNPR